jgi:hypothetical protein
MKRLTKVLVLLTLIFSLSACHVTTYPQRQILEIEFDYHPQQSNWAAATKTIFEYHGFYYTQADLVDYHYRYVHSDIPSIDDISWILWDLAGIDSYVSSTLSRRDLTSEIDRGNPILIQYGAYYSGHYLVIYGYDSDGYYYIHEPGYGTRLLRYDDLDHHYFQGHGYYWESSLILDY